MLSLDVHREANMSDDFEDWDRHNYTDEIVCPYCFYEFDDSWEFQDDSYDVDGPLECNSCGKEFYMYRNISVSYSTVKIKDAKDI